MWCVADLNEAYIAKMEDVLERYEQSYDPKEPVVCLDEKPITLHADVRPASPAVPGREARRDNEYERRGTANVFCAVEPKAGRHFTFPTPDRSAFQFAQVIFHLAMQYPEAETIHLVMDNLNIHRRKSLTDLYGAEVGGEIWNRFTVHYTPTHGSWLNQAEIEIGIFSVRRQLFFPVSDNYFSLSATTTSFAERRFFSTLVLTGAEDKALQGCNLSAASGARPGRGRA
jgi:hypothetical protein